MLFHSFAIGETFLLVVVLDVDVDVEGGSSRSGSNRNSPTGTFLRYSAD